MKFRIKSDGIIFEAEKTQKEFDEHLTKVITGEDESEWLHIMEWSKKYPIL